MSETLLPCPFCGGQAALSWNKKEVVCLKCEALGQFCDTEAEAIEAWNTRNAGTCEPPYDELLRCLENDWNIRASWDGLRKFWCIELTEEGVKLRDAELRGDAE